MNNSDKLSETLLTDNPKRFVLFPIQYGTIFEYYKKHLACFWTAEEIDLDTDIKDCLLYTSPSPRDLSTSRMPSSA